MTVYLDDKDKFQVYLTKEEVRSIEDTINILDSLGKRCIELDPLSDYGRLITFIQEKLYKLLYEDSHYSCFQYGFPEPKDFKKLVNNTRKKLVDIKKKSEMDINKLEKGFASNMDVTYFQKINKEVNYNRGRISTCEALLKDLGEYYDM